MMGAGVRVLGGCWEGVVRGLAGGEGWGWGKKNVDFLHTKPYADTRTTNIDI